MKFTRKPLADPPLASLRAYRALLDHHTSEIAVLPAFAAKQVKARHVWEPLKANLVRALTRWLQARGDHAAPITLADLARLVAEMQRDADGRLQDRPPGVVAFAEQLGAALARNHDRAREIASRHVAEQVHVLDVMRPGTPAIVWPGRRA